MLQYGHYLEYCLRLLGLIFVAKDGEANFVVAHKKDIKKV